LTIYEHVLQKHSTNKQSSQYCLGADTRAKYQAEVHP
jgi:hypothetical protein